MNPYPIYVKYIIHKVKYALLYVKYFLQFFVNFFKISKNAPFDYLKPAPKTTYKPQNQITESFYTFICPFAL